MTDLIHQAPTRPTQTPQGHFDRDLWTCLLSLIRIQVDYSQLIRLSPDVQPLQLQSLCLRGKANHTESPQLPKDQELSMFITTKQREQYTNEALQPPGLLKISSEELEGSMIIHSSCTGSGVIVMSSHSSGGLHVWEKPNLQQASSRGIFTLPLEANQSHLCLKNKN